MIKFPKSNIFVLILFLCFGCNTMPDKELGLDINEGVALPKFDIISIEIKEGFRKDLWEHLVVQCKYWDAKEPFDVWISPVYSPEVLSLKEYGYSIGIFNHAKINDEEGKFGGAIIVNNKPDAKLPGGRNKIKLDKIKIVYRGRKTKKEVSTLITTVNARWDVQSQKLKIGRNE